MKKLFALIIVNLIIVNLSFSQSAFSILGKSGGQLLQDLSKKKEWRAIGKAIETASDRTYEMEKIAQQNKEELTIRVNPDNTRSIYPAEGYKWVNSKDNNDYRVVKISETDRDSYNSSQELLEKSMNYFDSGDWDIAINYCNRSISMEESYLGYFIRSMCYSQKGFYSKALEDLGNTLNFELDDEWYNILYIMKSEILIKNQDFAEAVEVSNFCITSLNLTDEELSIALTQRATSKYSLKQYESALIDFNRCIEIKPNIDAYVNRGLTKSALNDNQGAISDYTIAIELLKNNHELNAVNRNSLSTVYTNRSIIYFESKDYQLALNDANSALKWTPDYAKAYVARGLAKVKLGFKESGESDFDKAIELGVPLDKNELEEFLKSN